LNLVYQKLTENVKTILWVVYLPELMDHFRNGIVYDFFSSPTIISSSTSYVSHAISFITINFKYKKSRWQSPTLL